MCKHSKSDVTVLEQRQRGLDARGNDPAAVKRESSWAVKVVSDVSDADLQLQLAHARQLAEDYAAYPTGRKLQAALAALPANPTGMQITELLLDANGGFKELMDFVGNNVGAQRPDLKDQGRSQPFFADRGRKIMERPRAGSFANPHGGIATGRNRSGSTSDVFTAPVQHAKGSLIGDQTSETYKKFQQSGAPFIGGASGTVQFIVMEMEAKKPLAQLSNAERSEREKLLALNAARLVAGGHHSMSECIIAARAYGYFANIPDPLQDYDASMKALEAHVGKLGLGAGGKPLSRDTEVHNDDPETVRLRDRMAAVQAAYDRISDQIPATMKGPINDAMRSAQARLNAGNLRGAAQKLDDAHDRIRIEAQVRDIYARGSATVMTPEDLAQRIGGTAKKAKKPSAELKVVQDQLAAYTQSSKELFGRHMDHDMVALGIEELTAGLTKTKAAATAYIAKHGQNKKMAAGVAAMRELITKADEEALQLKKVMQNAQLDARAAQLTLEQAIAFTRFGVDPATQGSPDVLREDRIDSGLSNENFGSGAVNSVKKLVYKADATHGQETRIFKPEPAAPPVPGWAQVTGIDPANPKFGKRNIASSKACAAVGLGAMIPPASFATYKGELGLAMQMAPGKSLVKKVDVDITATADNIVELNPALFARAQGDKDWATKLPAAYRHAGGRIYKAEPHGRPLPLVAPPAPAAVVAQVQRQTTSLQVLDALCGQLDRHPENYLLDVDPTGAVTLTGIDNDFSFGKDLHDPDRGLTANQMGLPPLIDRTLFTRIDGLDWATYSAGMDAELDAEELAGARARFDWVQGKVRDMNRDGLVVDNWQTFVKDGKSAKDILMEDGDGSGNNYYKRDVKAQRSYQQRGAIVND
jgi:hypothetical protein